MHAEKKLFHAVDFRAKWKMRRGLRARVCVRGRVVILIRDNVRRDKFEHDGREPQDNPPHASELSDSRQSRNRIKGGRRAMKTLVTEAPCLDVGELKKNGLFEPSPPPEIVVRSRESEFFVKRLMNQASLAVRFEGETASGVETVNILSASLKHGERPYLECPQTKDRSLKLYAIGDKLASAQAHDLVHPSRVAKKQILEHDAFADFRLWYRERHSTEAAMARGNWYFPDDDRVRYLTKCHTRGAHLSPVRFKGVTNKALNLALPQVNIRALEEYGRIEQSKSSWVCLKYYLDPYSKYLTTVCMIFDLRKGADLEVRFSVEQEYEKIKMGYIELVEVAGRLMFVCPIERKPTNTLHLREGMLGSAAGLAIRRSLLRAGPWIGEPRG